MPTTAAGSVTGIKVYVSNSFATAGGTSSAYGAIATSGISAVGRQSLDTLTGPQLLNWQSTSADILLPDPQRPMSQVVFTVAITGTSLTTLATGKLYFTLRYNIADPDLGSPSAYPYGNPQ